MRNQMLPGIRRALPLWLLACCLTATAEPVLTLSTSVGPPLTTAAHDGFMDRVMAEAFRRIGGEARIVRIESSERALINANNGVDDGVVPRIKGLEASYPNLVRVPEKVYENDFVAIALRFRFATPDWESLAPYQVAYMIGWKIFDQNLGGRQNVTQVKTADQLFSLLQQDRTDVILYERWRGFGRPAIWACPSGSWNRRSRGPTCSAICTANTPGSCPSSRLPWPT